MPTCKKCREQYARGAKGRKEPLQLECGHSFCRSCLLSQEAAGPMRCHICKRKHTWPRVKEIPVNEDMLSAVSLAPSSVGVGKVVLLNIQLSVMLVRQLISHSIWLYIFGIFSLLRYLLTQLYYPLTLFADIVGSKESGTI